MIDKINIQINDSNLFPLFYDFDLKKVRPRGYSCKLELFTFGSITASLENANRLDNIVYVKTNSLPNKKGVFLVDYLHIMINTELFIKSVKNAGFGRKIYITTSESFDIEDKLRFHNEIGIKFVGFI